MRNSDIMIAAKQLCVTKASNLKYYGEPVRTPCHKSTSWNIESSVKTLRCQCCDQPTAVTIEGLKAFCFACKKDCTKSFLAQTGS